MEDLRRLREDRGVTLKSMAKLLKVNISYLSRLERGLVPGSEKISNQYREVLGTVQSRLQLVERDEEKEPPQGVAFNTITLTRNPQWSLGSLSPDYYPSQNPNLADFVSVGTPCKPITEPFSGDISAGKNSYVYDAHTYHTKVPPEGIKTLIEHFTRPGDVVLDPFCGSGMTGVAALETGRKAILNDLSPAATFIAYNLCTPIDASTYQAAIKAVLDMTKNTEEELYHTRCRACGKPALIQYMVWSYGVMCHCCGHEFVLWDVARDERDSVRESKILTEFDCPHCATHLRKRDLKRTTRHPVQVGYRCCMKGLKESTAVPDESDLRILKTLEDNGVPDDLWYPTTPFPPGINTRQPINAGIDSIDKAYTTRALKAMATLWNVAVQWPDPHIRFKLLFTITSLYQRVTLFSEFRFWGGSSNTANFNVPAIINEQNVFKTFERKANTIRWYFADAPKVERALRVTTQSACSLPQLPERSVDYIFTDPPFGSNINYSEMNFLWESWLRLYTDPTEEAIVNKVQGKGVSDYETLLKSAFSEMRRVLKDDGWLTVVFHNSSADVWAALQRAVTGAGFQITGTRTFDKQHGTFKQFVSDNSVGYDLVLECRKTAQEKVVVGCDVAETRELAREFVRNKLVSGKDYVVHYLHVQRADEVNYRRLYAEWLAETVADRSVDLSFEEFRAVASEVWSKLAQTRG